MQDHNEVVFHKALEPEGLAPPGFHHDSIVGVISGQSVNIWFMHSLFNALKTAENRRFSADWLLIYGPYIHQNRNRLANEFLKTTDRQWLLMIDNDMVFKPEDVTSLCQVADEKGPGIYSAPYLIEDGVLVCGPWDHEIEKVYHPMLKLPAEPQQVGVVGAGFTLVHRDVLEAVGENAFSPVRENAGEDLSLCWRAREAGFTPWLVPSVCPGHSKSFVIYPDSSVRNMVGETVNLVQTDPKDAEPAVDKE